MLTSCSKWLDVKPETQKDREELINTTSGFEQMLSGVYAGMTDAGLYGHQLSYGFVESVAYNHFFADETSGPFINWNYTSTNARPIIDAVWSKMYNTIANANSILKDIDNRKSLFTEQEYSVIKGESLALRAFLHFDLLRMFAPAYTLNNDIIAIPYVDSYEAVRSTHLKSIDVMKKVINDLDSAEVLLKKWDPIFQIGLTNSTSAKNDFLTNRQYRFNYWALQAFKARVYMYAGDKVKAASYANKVITEGPFTWVNPATLTGNNPDVVFFPEVIMALNVSNLETYYQTYFASGTYKVSNGSSSYATRIFDDLNDYRYLYQMTSDSYGNKSVSAKYKQSPLSTIALKKQTVPLMRLGEMYLIAAECALSANDKPTAISLVRELRLRRGYLSADRSVSDNITDALLQTLIVKEFRKETYMEGQTFFNYKRLNQIKIPGLFAWWGEPIAGPVKFILPIPENEKEFGNIPAN